MHHHDRNHADTTLSRLGHAIAHPLRSDPSIWCDFRSPEQSALAVSEKGRRSANPSGLATPSQHHQLAQPRKRVEPVERVLRKRDPYDLPTWGSFESVLRASWARLRRPRTSHRGLGRPPQTANPSVGTGV
ncbi:hypothetical protein IEO21_06287 [Rhodonia placenta]|uniref:Uncharacterized protein n=1 Tax=Rhodonia placenta TaxID=104341 RepID=A0A8H7U1G6_9APHY|nr:hypothetical protein IEO21_06287 [Postia placenta]